MRAVVTDVRAWSVQACFCVCVRHTREPYKMDEPIEMPFEIWTRVDPGNHVLGGDPDRAGESDNSVDMPR